MPYKNEVMTACKTSRENAFSIATLRDVYNAFVDYMSESECHSCGMFESYGVVLDFKAIEDNIVKMFCKDDLKVITLCLRQEAYTPLALVLATYIESRCRVRNPLDTASLTCNNEQVRKKENELWDSV